MAEEPVVRLVRVSGHITATYTYGNSLLRKDGETPLFDGLGSERTVTNSSGSGTGSLTLSAFGGTVTSSGSSTSAYKFGATSGYRDDGDAGLVKVGCRYYDPETGRFTSRDTVLSQKAYVYCDSDPVNHLDPSGHLDVMGDIGAGLLVGSIAVLVVVSLPIDIAVIGGAVGIAVIGAVGGAIGGGYNEKSEGSSTGTILAGAGIGAVAGGLFGGAVGKCMPPTARPPTGAPPNPPGTWPPPPIRPPGFPGSDENFASILN